jgi:hypothetical protein
VDWSRGPQPLPPVDLMHPTLVARPFHRDGLVYEEKVDAYRMLAYKTGRAVSLINVNQNRGQARCGAGARAVPGLQLPAA